MEGNYPPGVSGTEPQIVGYDDFDDDVEICECCGRDINGYDSGQPCPSCCPHDYACGTEECDFCTYSEECCRLNFG